MLAQTTSVPSLARAPRGRSSGASSAAKVATEKAARTGMSLFTLHTLLPRPKRALSDRALHAAVTDYRKA